MFDHRALKKSQTLDSKDSQICWSISSECTVFNLGYFVAEPMNTRRLLYTPSSSILPMFMNLLLVAGTNFAGTSVKHKLYNVLLSSPSKWSLGQVNLISSVGFWSLAVHLF